MNEYYYLSHGGPGSGRYPLGSGDRPYQKFEDSRRKRGGISGYIRSRREKKAEEKLQKKRNEQIKKQMEEEQRKQQHYADKERVLREGKASEVLRYQGELTNRELEDAANRLRLEKQLSSYSEEEKKSSLNNLKRVQSYTNVGSALAKDGISLWNSFASIYNVTDNGKKAPLPLIRSGDGKNKK